MINESIIRYRISRILEKCQTNIICEEIKNRDNYFIVKFYGGDNGFGRLTDYLSDIKLIVDQFEEDVWLIDWTNDTPDDFWILRIGIQDIKLCDLKEQ